MKYILVDEDEGQINVFDNKEAMIDHFDNWGVGPGYHPESLPLDCFYYFEVEDDFKLTLEDIDHKSFIFGAIEDCERYKKSDDLIKDHRIFYKEDE